MVYVFTSIMNGNRKWFLTIAVLVILLILVWGYIIVRTIWPGQPVATNFPAKEVPTGFPAQFNVEPAAPVLENYSISTPTSTTAVREFQSSQDLLALYTSFYYF